MSFTSFEKRFRLPKWAIWALVVGFFGVWGSGFVAALSFGGCTNRSLTDPKKEIYCNISIASGALIDFLSLDRAKRSPLFLNRGMVLATSGDLDGARRDFRRALLDAADAQQTGQITIPRDLKLYFVARLFSAMQQEPISDITTITWLQVVRELSCGSPGTVAPELCLDPSQ
jgi:hypothetical protein